MEAVESDLIMAYELKAIWKKMLQENQYKQYKLVKKLGSMQQAFENRITKSKSLHSAAEVLTKIGGTAQEVDNVKGLQNRTQRKVMRFGKGAQVPLQLSLYVLKAEEQLLRQCLNSEIPLTLAEIIAEITLADNFKDTLGIGG